MTILQRNVLTAHRRSNNLKEHREAFESVNGVAPIELPDPMTQISGMIAELMEFKYLTSKEITQAVFQLRRIPEVKDSIKHTAMLTMVSKALGYLSHNELVANAVGENKVITNRNFGKGLSQIHETVTAEHDMKLIKFWELCSEVFLYVKVTDIDFTSLGWVERAQTLTDWYDLYVHPIKNASDIHVTPPEESELNWTALVFSMALAGKYSTRMARGVWKNVFKAIPNVCTGGECRAMSMQLMERNIDYLQNFNKRVSND